MTSLHQKFSTDPKRIRPLNEKDPNVLSSNPTLPAVRATDFLHNKPETLITASDDMICTTQLTHITHRKGKFFKERSAERVSLLKEHYVMSPGSETKQTEILDLFGLFDCKEGKQMATNAISKAFGNEVTLSRKKHCYKKLRNKLSSDITDDELIQLDQESEIKKMKCLIQEQKNESLAGAKKSVI